MGVLVCHVQVRANVCGLAATCVHVPGGMIAVSQANVTRVLEQSVMSCDGYRSHALTRDVYSSVGTDDRDSGEGNHVDDTMVP